MKLYFVRHGKDNDRYRGGWSNLDLTPKGIEQAKHLARYLKENNNEYNITQIISSDLTRATTTANIIANELQLPIQKEFSLREINNGDLAGILNETAFQKYPGLFFSSLDMNETYPNGESPNDFYQRIKNWFYDFCTENIEDNVLIVTHGGVINIIYHLIKGIDGNNVHTAEEVLLGKCDYPPFGPIVVCGGGEVGAETAHYLAEKNHCVTLVEMQQDILNDMMPLTKVCLTEMLHESGVQIKTNFTVKEITDHSVVGLDENGNEVTLPAELVVSAFGYKSYNPLEEIAKAHCKEVYVVGGAVKAGSAIPATKEGMEAGLKV